MSVEEPEKNSFEPSSLKQKSEKKEQKNLNAIVHSAQSRKYHQLVKLPFGDGTDATLLYKVTLLANDAIRTRHLVFKNMEYMISNWTSDEFPNVLYICLDGYFAGYLLSGKPATERVAALELVDVQAVIDESDVRTYELRYALKDSVTWELGLNQLELNFRLKIDDVDTAVTLPLPNPMVINLEIREDK